LAKPQFEAGRDRVPRGGVVRDPAVHAEVLDRLTRGLGDLGLLVVDAVPSPLLGADGNREFLLHVRRDGAARSPEQVAALAGSRP
jgi:23S rRNA (cytidine1920-2'-O)/16S rRNA (cytidine1409-2'-O)-methyltransferase